LPARLNISNDENCQPVAKTARVSRKRSALSEKNSQESEVELPPSKKLKTNGKHF
jgi:hypothetical protein